MEAFSLPDAGSPPWEGPEHAVHVACLAAQGIDLAERRGPSVGMPWQLTVAASRFCRFHLGSLRAAGFWTALREPVSSWGLPGSSDFAPDATLLDADGASTELVGNLLSLVPGDVSAELEEAIMREALYHCRSAALQGQYVTFRRFIIEHPVLTAEELQDAHLGQLAVLDDDLRALIKRAYQPVPRSYWDREGGVPICGACCWTLQTTGSTHKCHSGVCAVRAGRQPLRVDPRPNLYRLKKGMARSIAAPGRIELELFTWLNDEGLASELYPGVDRYDISVEIGGETWTVDVKDWRDPFLLGRHLRETAPPPDPDGARVFIVVPDDRTASHGKETYLRILKSHAPQHLSLLTVADFKRDVRLRRAVGA